MPKKRRKIGTMVDIIGRKIKVGDTLIYPDYYGKRIILYFCVCAKIVNDEYIEIYRYNYASGNWRKFVPETPNRLFIIDIPEGHSLESLNAHSSDTLTKPVEVEPIQILKVKRNYASRKP